MNRKYIVILISVSILIAITIVAIRFQNNGTDESVQKMTFTRLPNPVSDNIIFWNSKSPLSKDNFQLILEEDYIGDDVVLAESNIGFLVPPFFETEVTINGECQYEMKNYEVQAKFDETMSWLRLERAEQLNIVTITLDHEQRHFDIAEIYSRILTKSINDEFRNQKFSCPDTSPSSLRESVLTDAAKKILPLESKINEKFNKSQKTYEMETGHIIYEQEMTRNKPFEQQKKWNMKIDNCLDLDLDKINQCLELYSK